LVFILIGFVHQLGMIEKFIQNRFNGE